jgi:hypothetical protein
MYRLTFSKPQRWLKVSGQLHAPAALTPRKEPRYQLDRRMGGPQSQSGQHGEGKSFILLGLELRPLSHPARGQLMYRLRYFGFHKIYIPINLN